MRRIKYTKEVLQEAVNKSISFLGVVRELGLCQSGGTHQHITRTVRKFGISTEHFKGRAANCGSDHRPLKLKPSDILILRLDDRIEKTFRLREALLAIGREHVCSYCKTEPIWFGKPLVLQIHHFDGNKFNNVEDNLKFLCPNCHSQTDNFGHRNLKFQRTTL